VFKIKNKKAIQLSMNFLVSIIIGVALLSMGIVFLEKMREGGENLQQKLDEQTISELERIMIRGQRVAIAFRSKKVKAGDTAVFGLGVLNTLEDDQDFVINVTFDKAYGKDKREICNGDGDNCPDNNWVLFTSEDRQIKSNENEKYAIAVTPDKNAKQGVYIFNVYVCRTDESDYKSPCNGKDNSDNPKLEELYDDAIHKIYIEVI